MLVKMAGAGKFETLGITRRVRFEILGNEPVPALLYYFLTCFCRGKRRKYAGKKVTSTGDQTRNHQDTFTSEPPGQGCFIEGIKTIYIVGKGENSGNKYLIFP